VPAFFATVDFRVADQNGPVDLPLADRAVVVNMPSSNGWIARA
jgi:hypothetical protein